MPDRAKTSSARRAKSACGRRRRDEDAARCATTRVPRAARATACAPATTSPTRASASWGRPRALWVSSWKSNTRARATVSRMPKPRRSPSRDPLHFHPVKIHTPFHWPHEAARRWRAGAACGNSFKKRVLTQWHRTFFGDPESGMRGGSGRSALPHWLHWSARPRRKRLDWRNWQIMWKGT